MQDTTNYPHFIPDKPTGKDCFDGHSQERLAHSVCDYVRRIDAKPKGEAGNTMPRIIGLEGGWGSGKSNVMRMIEVELAKEGYHTFTYDAWGHQEDLQRRSILETMTNRLIDDKILRGEVTIQLRNGKRNTDTWTNQLSMLLSNKTTTIKHSVPRLSAASVWGICLVAAFAVMTVVSGLLLDNVCGFPVWLAVIMDISPIFFGACISICYHCNYGNWNRTLKLISQQEDSTIDEEYTSSEEPSVTEFKNWMRAMSDYLGSTKQKYHRLIIVFDNMDRLPSEKVMQLWSSIYTFFAGDEFENIWTVIPYDYEHLCQAIYGSVEGNDTKEKDKERIKQFISKTFPITYHVPEPVITDYSKLFYTYFDAAFSTKEHDREHICQVYMHMEEHPNPRTVIKFVNELVAMRLQWSDKKYRLQNQALYILKKDYLFYSGERLDAQLLSDNLFYKISPFYPDRDKVRVELCQYAYGLEDEKLAEELPIYNELKLHVTAGDAIWDFVAKPNFIPVFIKVMSEIDQVTLNNAIKSMTSLDSVDVPQEAKEVIQKKWDALANLKAESPFDIVQYDKSMTAIIKHASPHRVAKMAQSFAKAMQRLDVKNGADYYHALHQLHQTMDEVKIPYDDAKWYQSKSCEAEQFVQYVCEAKKEYSHYKLTTTNKGLNEYLLNGAIGGNSQVAAVVDCIKNDKDYDLTVLGQSLAEAIMEGTVSTDICVAAYVHRVLSPRKDILGERFKPETVSAYLNGNQASWAEQLPVGLEDVMAMSLADGKDLNEIDDQMLPRICKCKDYYFNYTDLLKHTGKEGSAYRKLNVYCVEHLEGGLLDTKYAARHLVELQKALGIEQQQLLKQFNQCPAMEWGEINSENEYVREVQNYVHQSFFAAYRDNPGNFSDSVIKLGVGAIKCQNIGFLVSAKQVNRMVTKLVVNGYWKAFVETYLGSKLMPQAGTILSTEAVTMLQWLYDHNEVTDEVLLETVLKHADEATLKVYLHTMMNNHFAKTDINNTQFLYFGRLLPMLGSNMDANTARGLIQHFIKPICKDSDCAAIIVSYKDFYLAIMKFDTTLATTFAKEIVDLEIYTDAAKELRELLPNNKVEKEIVD